MRKSVVIALSLLAGCEQGTGTLGAPPAPPPVMMPPPVDPPPTAFVAVRAANERTCAVDREGHVFCWGAVRTDEGAIEETRVPTIVPGIEGATDVVISSASEDAVACALVPGDGIHCWGRWDGRDVALMRLAGSEDARAIAGEAGRICAVLGGGGVRCWGPQNDPHACSGVTPRSLDEPPVDFTEFDDAVALRLSGGATCAVRTGGNLTCVVDPIAGERVVLRVDTGDISDVLVWHTEACFFGPGALCVARGRALECLTDVATGTGFESDAQAFTLPSTADPIRRVVTNAYASPACVLTEGDEVWCPGTPQDPVMGGVLDASSSGRHFCAITADGLTCVGSNEVGELGNGTPARYAEPRRVAIVDAATSLAAGAHHTCATTAAGAVMCWGSNSQKQRGFEVDAPPAASFFAYEPAPSVLPGPVALSSPVERVFADAFRTCATAPTGVVCWGQELTHRLPLATPTQIPEVGAATSVAAGDDSQACAVDAAGTLLCWGRGYYGRRSGVERVALSGRASEVDGDTYHACARLDDGTVRCWGGHVAGSLSEGQPLRPQVVAGLGDVVDVSGTCAVTSDERLFCWMPPFAAEPGVPRAIADGVVAVDGPCVIRTDRTVACFRDYADRDRGIDTSLKPVPGASDAVELATGEDHACLRDSTGAVRCWGWAEGGRLGDGTKTWFSPDE